MRRNLAFRSWFYFRQGWSIYFAFIMAAINTLTVTYFLAVDEYPFLTDIFPTFGHYIIIVCSIGIPLLVIIGYAHFKRSSALRSEADIQMEVNPYWRRLLINTELMIPLYLRLSDFIIKESKGEKLTKDELDEMAKLQNDLNEHYKTKDATYKRGSIGESTIERLRGLDE